MAETIGDDLRMVSPGAKERRPGAVKRVRSSSCPEAAGPGFRNRSAQPRSSSMRHKERDQHVLGIGTLRRLRA